jgi:protein-disulfide isomerase
MAEERLTKNERREQAREQAAKARAAQAKKAKRNRIVLFSSIGLIVVALGLIVTLIVVNSQQQAALIAKSATGPKNMASGGLVFTSTTAVKQTPAAKSIKPTADVKDKVKVDIFLDIQCPYCKALDLAARDYLATELNAGKITYEVHPVVFINEYSNRGANAFACVANSEPKRAWDYLSLLYDNQPTETKQGGLPNSELATLAQKAGVEHQSTVNCIGGSTTARYQSWLQSTTAFATSKGLPGSNVKSIQSTPTVIIDGKQMFFKNDYLGDLRAAMDAAAKAKGVTLAPFTATGTNGETTAPSTSGDSGAAK